MLVFDDHERQINTRPEIEQLRARAGAIAAGEGGLPLHQEIITLLIRMGELAQGLCDDAFARAGEDDEDPTTAAAIAALRVIARAVLHSWSGAEDEARASLRAFAQRLAMLAPLPLAQTVAGRRQEGFAFYALYPETYIRAARAIGPGVGAVIGIRSIGLALGAVAAEAVEAPLLVSVRPVGLPFERDLRLGQALGEKLKAISGPIAIADEGPGLSGSSFAAVARMLEKWDVATDRLHFLPSHGGPPGWAASPAIQDIWRRTPRHVVQGDREVFAPGSRFGTLADWCRDLTGPAIAPLVDISGGQWRGRRLPDAPARPESERRKFLLASAQGTFLLRFAGLGPYGAAALKRGRTLAGAGFVPQVLGLRHGFLVERWIDEASAAPQTGAAREDFLRHLAAYLAFRASHLPAAPDAGAPLPALAAMLQRNAGEALGASPPLEAWTRAADNLASRVRRVGTDNRLQPWEWLHLPDGHFLKADALDHCAAHDLIGCQDVSWDVAAAQVEFDLTAVESEELRARMEQTGTRVDRDLVAFYRPCYLAFQAGLWTGTGGQRRPTRRENPEHETYMRYTEKLKLELYLHNYALA